MGAENLVKADMYQKPFKNKRHRRMTLIEHKPVDIAFGLMFNQKRGELLERMIALAKIIFGIGPGIDTKRREANRGMLTESIERIGSADGATIRLRNKEWITAAVITPAPFDEVGLVNIRRVDIEARRTGIVQFGTENDKGPSVDNELGS